MLAEILSDNASKIEEEKLSVVCEHVMLAGAVIDGLGIDKEGIPVLIFKVSHIISECEKLFVEAVSALETLRGSSKLLSPFMDISKTPVEPRLIFLGERFPKKFVNALKQVKAHIKLLKVSIIFDFRHPFQLKLVYDSKLPDKNLLHPEEHVYIEDKSLILRSQKGKKLLHLKEHSYPSSFEEEVSLSPFLSEFVDKISEFGPDITISAKLGYTAFYRTFNFCVTHDKEEILEVGFKLFSDNRNKRIHDATDWGWATVNVFVPVYRVEEIDDELLAWLREAYEKAK